MITRLFIAPLLATILLAPLASLSAADSQPNIVFIVSDDQGAGDYGFMGHPHVQTPHLDKLAAQSLMFPRGFVPTSVCCPSLATIITGLYPHQHKVTANDPPLPPGAKAKGGRGSTPELTARWNGMLDNVPTLPRLLASRGYVSFQTGKWWQGDFTRGGFTHGMSKGSRHGDEGLTIGREGLQPIYDFIADSRQQQKPFFVWYAPLMPHTPHTPPERLFKKYAAKTDSPHVARYWAMCEWFDESCGELLDHLEKENLSENTIVVYVTDNGWIQSTTTAGFAPKSKTSPFDAGHRTPILVRWPGHVTPTKSAALASSIDLVPTVLAALELPAPEGLRGVNLLDTGAVESRQQVFGEDFTIRSQTLDDVNANVLWRWVTDGRWRLILPRTFEAEGSLRTIPQDNYLKPYLITTLKAAQPVLYDLESDPKEEINVAGDHPEIVSALRIKLDAHWKPRPSPETTAAISGTPPGFSPKEIAFRQVDLENTSETSANISIGDLDGDGDVDIVLAKGRHWPLHNKILINNGAGEFQVNRNLGDLPDRSYTTALADGDGDGDLDILVSNDKPDEKRVYRNDGKGNFAAAGTFGKPSWNTRNISIADLNGDRFPDLVVANRKSQSFIILNDGQGNFPDKKWTAIPSESASTIVTADFNGDGLTDLAIPQRDGGASQVLFNDSEFLFQRATTFGPASSSARACAAGDLNGDGAMDLIVGDDRLGTRLCLNDGRGDFPTMMEVGDSKLIPCSIAVSDMNADQRLDIVVGYLSGGSSVFLNHGKATKFDGVPFGDAKGAVYGIAIGDVNGDGRNDIAQARSEAPNVLFLSEQPHKE